MGWLSGRDKGTKSNGTDRPARVVPSAKCPCGNGRPIGHPGKCTIPTGTFRNGQRKPKSTGRIGDTVSGRKYVRKPGPRF